MERKSIQLLTRHAPPAWWSDLQAFDGLDCEWTVSHEFDPLASVVVIPRNELTSVRKEHLSFSKAYILVDHGWTAQNLRRGLQALRGALIMDTAQGVEELS